MKHKMSLIELVARINEKIGPRQRSNKIHAFCKYRKDKNEPLGNENSVINQFKQYFKEARDSAKDGKPHNNGRAFELLSSFYEFLELGEGRIVINNLPPNPFDDFLSTREKRLIHITGRNIAEEIKNPETSN